MKKIALVLSLLSIWINISVAQNDLSLFKYIPPIKSDTPDWAVEMYSPTCNVWKVDWLYDQYYKTNTFAKTIHTQNYKHWRQAVNDYCKVDGTINLPSRKEEDELINRVKAQKSAQRSTNIWESIGPFATYRNGTLELDSHHANVYAINQSTNNSNLILAGTESGGVFHSLDKGISWSLITKDEPFSGGITAVQIDPKDDNRYLIYANSRIYESTNSGATWTELYYVDARVDEIKFDPDDTDHIYLAAQNGLHRSLDDGSNWNISYTNACWDIDWNPSNGSMLYLLMSDGVNKTDFYKSTDNGNSFTQVSTGWYVPENSTEASEGGGKIAVSPDDPTRVYACLIGQSKDGDSGWIGLYRSNNSGDSWYLPSGQIGSPYQSVNTMPWNAAAYSDGYHQGFYNFDCEASPNDANVVWFGTIRLSETTDGGATYQSIGAANSTRLSHIHADIQAIEVSGNDIWVASDGGINYSNDELLSHDSRHEGMIASNFWGFGVGWNEDVYVGGKYHNGNTAYVGSYGLGNTHNVGGVEESTGYVNPLDNKTTYFNQYWSGYTVTKKLPSTIGGTAINGNPVNLIPNESYSQSSSSGLYFHPKYADKMYAGKDNMIYSSNDAGSTWTVLHTFPAGKVYEIEIARSNPDIMYCVFQPGGGYWDWCEIHKSIDGGASFQKLTDIDANRWRLEFAIDPYNPDEIWAIPVNGANGEKVYRSVDGGTNWTNMTSDMLDDHNTRDIAFQPGSNGVVYLATNYSYFFYDPGMNVWIDYGSGLPFETRILQTRPFYAQNTLRVGTNGRGVWEAPIPVPYAPSLEIMTSNDEVNCGRDTVKFDSYSIMDINNVSWSWSFNPTPQFVDDTSFRNPKVVFGTSGTYDVTLDAVLPNGTNLSKTETAFVTVSGGCNPDTIPGDMFKTMASGDYVQLPAFGLNTNTFTMSAWIKPDGIQDDYASILMADDDAAGLNFREGNNTLAYHWPGGQWWWDSNLIAPSGEWSHVALVATPSSLTIYLNGEASVHNITLTQTQINAMKIGSYKGWGSRNYRGEIDEVCIWNRSLSQDEIRQYRHLTKEDVIANDPDFIAYYQLNDEGSAILDRIGTRHGAMVGGSSSLITSNAPVGGGSSEKHAITAAGDYSFANGAIQLNFDNSGSLPNGDVWGTVIHLLPDDSPSSNEGLESYFIVNNYGAADYDASTYITLDDPLSSPLMSSTTNPGALELLNRDENAFGNTWNTVCNNPNVSGEDYGFVSTNCDLQSLSSQYFIYKKCLQNSNEVTDYINGETAEVIVIDNVTATNSIQSGASVLYQGGTDVLLDNGFCAEAGSLFEANIGGCDQ